MTGLRVRAALALVVLVSAVGAVTARSAEAATAPSLNRVDVFGRGPGDLVDVQGNGFEPGSTVTVVMVGTTTSLALASATTRADGAVYLPATTRIPLAATPGTYQLTATSEAGSTATSGPFTISPPTVVLPRSLRAGQPASTTYTDTVIRLAGLANGSGVVRTVTVDGVAAPTQWWKDSRARAFTGIGFALPTDLTVGDHNVVFTQTGATPYRFTAVVPVLPPVIVVSPSPLANDAHIPLSIENAGCGGDVFDVTVVGAAGDRHTGLRFSVPATGSCTAPIDFLVVDDLSSGTATMTVVSRSNGATDSLEFPVAGSTVVSPRGLVSGQRLVSGDGSFQLVLQSDGNVVVYSSGLVFWSSRTSGHPGSRLVVQSDGNVVLYSPAGKALWTTATSGIGPAARFGLSHEGNVVVTTSRGRTAWSSFTLGGLDAEMLHSTELLFRGQFLVTGLGVPDVGSTLNATMQPDGNFVLSTPWRGPLWSTRTQGHPNAYLLLQADGQLVVRGPDERVLWTNRVHAANARLVPQSDGNLVEYSATGKALWSSGTVIR